MFHTISNIPDDVWQWAREQGGRVGPATYLRDILISAAMNGNGKPQPRGRHDTLQPKAKSAIIEVLEGRKIYAHGCKAILNANDWDWIDPTGMMKKDPEEVQDFLQCCSYEVGMFNDMFASRRNLLKMIFDAYMRAHGGYRED